MNDLPSARRVAIFKSAEARYDRQHVHAAVVATLSLMGLDGDAGDGRGPLASLIAPGETVLLKPNLIRQSHLLNDDWEHVITNGEVVRAVATLAAQALQGRGRLVIADGPQTDSDFDTIAKLTRLEDIRTEVLGHSGMDIEILDLREQLWIERDGGIVERQELPGDPAGYVEFDLSSRSEFATYPGCGQLYGADYDFEFTRRAHTGGRHVYRMASTPIAADVFINLPKMKTHKKTGVTLSLKNLVGVHGNRNYLPHFTVGDEGHGGDELPGSGPAQALQSQLIQWMKTRLARRGGVSNRSLRLIKRLGYRTLGSTEEVTRSGNWYGNDTTWRTVLDLNKLLFYGRADGTFAPAPWKRYLTIIDGIIAGEGNGPMAPDPRAVGLLVAGLSPVAVDTACTAIMGFDPFRLRMLSGAWNVERMPLADFTQDQIVCSSNVGYWSGTLPALLDAPHLAFRPHFGWCGHVERPASLRASEAR